MPRKQEDLVYQSEEVGSVAGSNSKAPIHRCPKKHKASIGLPTVRPVKLSHLSNNARPYVSGNESANIPGRPLNTSLLRFPNEYIRPDLTGIINGDGSIPLPMNCVSYSKRATLYEASHLNVPTFIPNIFTLATSTILIPPYLSLQFPQPSFFCLS